MEIYDEIGSNYNESPPNDITSYYCPYGVAPLTEPSIIPVKVSKNFSDICWQDVVFFVISVGMIFYSLINVLRLI